jgi:hypothetical protein
VAQANHSDDHGDGSDEYRDEPLQHGWASRRHQIDRLGAGRRP